ncbi:GNAT family N-acetyltransferase [Xenorhabdus bharatensis]|uniref:GNAT family N-acetyltransferase n=1 Tax=Xenorhabdus bharatensis TaxID=3136256 RepID=UPI0030F41CAA
MNNEKKLFGRSIFLKLVSEDDASFIYSLRNNNKLNKYLSKTDGNIIDQLNWIKKYKKREKENLEYYFKIKRIDNNIDIGTVRLYDFKDNPKSFCWGSWILTENKTPNSAIESALLVYKFAFDEKNFEQSHFDVRKENEKVISFHKKLGAKIINEDDLNYYFTYQNEDYNKISNIYNKFI